VAHGDGWKVFRRSRHHSLQSTRQTPAGSIGQCTMHPIVDVSKHRRGSAAALRRGGKYRIHSLPVALKVLSIQFHVRAGRGAAGWREGACMRTRCDARHARRTHRPAAGTNVEVSFPALERRDVDPGILQRVANAAGDVSTAAGLSAVYADRVGAHLHSPCPVTENHRAILHHAHHAVGDSPWASCSTAPGLRSGGPGCRRPRRRGRANTSCAHRQVLPFLAGLHKFSNWPATTKHEIWIDRLDGAGRLPGAVHVVPRRQRWRECAMCFHMGHLVAGPRVREFACSAPDLVGDEVLDLAGPFMPGKGRAAEGRAGRG